MTTPAHQPQLPDLPIRRVEEMGLKELERIRLILRGGSDSVITSGSTR